MARKLIDYVVQDSQGNAISSAQVTITNRADNSAATVYTSESGGGTFPTNVLLTDSTGHINGGTLNAQAWLPEGQYNLAVSSNNINPVTVPFEADPANTVTGTMTRGGLTIGQVSTTDPGISAGGGDSMLYRSAPASWQMVGGLNIVGDLTVGGAVNAGAVNNVTQAGTDLLQKGVLGSGDYAVSGLSVNGVTGAITLTIAGGTAYMGSPLVRSTYAGSTQTFTPTFLPTAGNIAVYAIDLAPPTNWNAAPSVVFTTVGTAYGTNTAAWADAASFTGLASGNMRIFAITIQNVAGTYQLAGPASPPSLNYLSQLDRRPWARGANWYQTGVSWSANNTSMQTSPSYLLARTECSGAMVVATLTATVWATGLTGPGGVKVALGRDGDFTLFTTEIDFNANYSGPVSIAPSFVFTPSAGSHFFQVGVGQTNVSGAWTAWIGGINNTSFNLVFREELRPSGAYNGNA